VKRREFIAGLGGAAAAWPIAARAQQLAMPVVGFLHLGSSVSFSYTASAVREGLKQFGYIEGQNVTIDYRWANNEADRLPELAADLVRRQVAVILAMGTNLPGLAAKAATTTIPIVFLSGADPVRDGLVAKFDRPGSNVTGVTFRTLELVPKRLGLLHELVPQATTVAHLANPNTPGTAEALQNLLATANTLRRQVIVAEARNENEFDSAFARFADGRAGVLVVGSSVLFDSHRQELVALAARYNLPAVYQDREYVMDGGLMSYGADFRAIFRIAGRYVGQILKGAKPSDLPVEQPTLFQLVINMKTATALGLEVPPILLIRADELIE
jgi:putative tryptophan/tyrosine transport system substrate-binding protein